LPFEKFYPAMADTAVRSRLHALLAEKDPFTSGDPQGIERRVTGRGGEQRKNVIVVVEESMSGEYLASFGNRDHLTPNLDRLAKESLFFTHLYATGTRTVRGLEAITLSIPPLPGTSLIKRPDNGGFFSWGSVMREKGYETSFVYAGYGYFDNMNAFFAGNGFDIVDRASFAPSEVTFSNAWGVCDEDLFGKVIQVSRDSWKRGKPFFTMVMTTSNHRPYTYPKGKIDIPPKHGRKGGVKYADYAIGRFIESARREPWFDDTVFVFVADHCASSAGKVALPVKRYEIPLLVYAPKMVRPAVVDTMMSQVDIAPTVLGLLNFGYRSRFLGRDVLGGDPARGRAFISTYQKLGYITGDRLVVLSPGRRSEEYRFDRGTGSLAPMEVSDQDLLDSLAYYQGNNLLYRNRLNRLR
ncbi:MAG TPA: LTA synthase family protein, partial [Verrucomicrobiae bacterium]|nr:LTA synthase family protein [Verrucomicrobiae bacterium]